MSEIKRRMPKLETAGDVKRFLEKLIRQVYVGELDAGKATKIGYLLNLLMSTIESHDFEQKFVEIEARLMAIQGDDWGVIREIIQEREKMVGG